MMASRPKHVVQDKVYKAWILTSFKSVVLFYDKDLKTWKVARDTVQARRDCIRPVQQDATIQHYGYQYIYSHSISKGSQ
jgi:hypothetical protein